MVTDEPIGPYCIGLPYRVPVPTWLNGSGVKKQAAAHLAGWAIPCFRPVTEDQEAEPGTTESVRRATRSGHSVIGQALHNIGYQWRYRPNLRRYWRARGQT